MKYTTLGRTGLEVSRLCLGCMSYGDPENWRPWVLDEADARPHFRAAFDAGINFFDTADMYSVGASEEITGKLLKEMAKRDEFVLATKLFFPHRSGPNSQGLSRKRVFDCCDASLKRLGLDYIDLYQIHRFDPVTPIEETIEALDALVRAGKVRYLGASSMAAWQFAKMVYTARFKGQHAFVSMQNHYNLIYREEEREMIPFCAAEGIGVIPWSPLARGFLAGDRTPETPEPTKRAQTDEYTRKLYYRPDDYEVAAAVKRVAEARGVKPIQVALAWILQAPGVTAPIVGTTRLEHLKDLIDGMDLTMTAEEVAAVEAPYRPHPVLGYVPPAAR